MGLAQPVTITTGDGVDGARATVDFGDGDEAVETVERQKGKPHSREKPNIAVVDVVAHLEDKPELTIQVRHLSLVNLLIWEDHNIVY